MASSCFPTFPLLSLAAEDPAAAASSSFGAVVHGWLQCLGQQHTLQNTVAPRCSGQHSGVPSGADPLPCHARV